MKAKKILIVGADPDLASTVHMCLSAYLIPVGIHFLPEDSLPPLETAIDLNNIHGEAKNDSAYMKALPKAIPALDEEAFCRAAAGEDIEILSGACGLRERDSFMRILLHCKNKLKIKRPTRHPAYMLDRLSFKCNGYLCSGYPGSGNMLVQSILQHITSHQSNAGVHDKVRDAARIYAFYYWSTLRNYIESHFYDAGFWRSQTSPTHQNYGALYLDLGESDRPSVLCGLRMNYPLWANPWSGSHEPPTAAGIDYFERHGFKFIFIVRNPLDIIISLAAKTTSFAGQRDVGGIIDNRDWFEDTLESVVYYYQQAKENRDRLVIVRYEDFLSSPAEAINNFAEAIGMPLSPDEAVSLWNTLSGSTLSADPGHYWRPSVGKWKEYIPVEYRQCIEDSGIMELAQEFGYTLDLGLLTRKQGDGNPPVKPDHTLLALEENRWFFCAGKTPSIFSSEIAVLKDKNLIAATYKKYQKPFRDLFNSDIFSRLLAAAGDDAEDNFITTAREAKVVSFDNFLAKDSRAAAAPPLLPAHTL